MVKTKNVEAAVDFYADSLTHMIDNGTANNQNEPDENATP